MTNKPLKDWTLGEVQKECAGREACDGCKFYMDVFYLKRDCMFYNCEYPEHWEERWDLSDKPKFTEDEQAALRVLKAAGVVRLEREGVMYLWATIDNIRYNLPTTLFPSIQPGESVEL